MCKRLRQRIPSDLCVRVCVAHASPVSEVFVTETDAGHKHVIDSSCCSQAVSIAEMRSKYCSLLLVRFRQKHIQQPTAVYVCSTQEATDKLTPTAEKRDRFTWTSCFEADRRRKWTRASPPRRVHIPDCYTTSTYVHRSGNTCTDGEDTELSPRSTRIDFHQMRTPVHVHPKDVCSS